MVLITGTTRGIGNGLLELYLLSPSHKIITANRDPNKEASKKLLDLPKATDPSLLLVKINVTVPADTAAAIEELTSYGLDHIDILIANIGIALLCFALAPGFQGEDGWCGKAHIWFPMHTAW